MTGVSLNFINSVLMSILADKVTSKIAEQVMRHLLHLSYFMPHIHLLALVCLSTFSHHALCNFVNIAGEGRLRSSGTDERPFRYWPIC